MLAFSVALAAALQGTSVQAPQLDTTLAVGRGDRLEAHVFSGSITVRAWNRSEVRVQATGMDEVRERAGRVRIRTAGPGVTYRGGVVRIEFHPGLGGDEADVTVWVPATMPVELEGTETTISVEGTTASVRANTIEGTIRVAGGAEFIELNSVDGGITATGVRGRLQANSVDGDVTVRDARGAVAANAVDGNIELTDVDGPNVQANTVDGNIGFRGPIRGGGTYRFVSHDGDVTATLVGTPDVEVSISTFSGEFESGFPVTLSGAAKAGRQFGFTVGKGGAQLHLESFDGTIRLERAGR